MRSERWEDPREIKRLLMKCEESNNMSGQILYYENAQGYSLIGESHSMILGSTGTGKTRRMLIPTLKNYIKAGESFIAVDPKGELYFNTGHEAEKTHNIKVIDLRNIFVSQHYNPLAAPYEDFTSGDRIRSQRAQEALEDIAYGLYPVSVSEAVDPYWNNSARSLFMGAVYTLFSVAKPEEINMASVYDIVSSGAEKINSFGGITYLKELTSKYLPKDSLVPMLLREYENNASDTKACIHSVFLEGISIFAKSQGLAELVGSDDMHINQLDGKDPTAIYIITPDETPIFEKLTGILVTQLMTHYISLAHDKYGGTLPARLHLILEETGNICRSIPNLPHYMTAARSRNIDITLVLQSMAQLETAYGAGKAATIIDNADVLVAFRTGFETMSHLSERCGYRETEMEGHYIIDPLITPSQLGRMETGQALVMINGRKFISWLPDFTEVFDCSGFRPPDPVKRSENKHVRRFDVIKYVKEKKNKNDLKTTSGSNVTSDFINKLAHKPQGEAQLFTPLLSEKRRSEDDEKFYKNFVTKIDERIAKLEEEEEAERKKEKEKNERSLTLVGMIGDNKQIAEAVCRHTGIKPQNAAKYLDELPHTFVFGSKAKAERAIKDISAAGGLVLPGVLEDKKD